MIIDIATLTGACVVALGEQVAGLLGTDDELKRKLKKASLDTGEKIWELPLWECYRESIKSDVADLKNAGAREGGAISAASFLREFAGVPPMGSHRYCRSGMDDKGGTILLEGRHRIRGPVADQVSQRFVLI